MKPIHYTILSFKRSGCHAVAQWVGSIIAPVCQYCDGNSSRVTEIIRDGELKPIRRDGTMLSLPCDTPVIVGCWNAEIKPDQSGLLSSTRILLIRDPFNLFASSKSSPLVAGEVSGGSFVNFVKRWIDFAEEFLGLTNFLNAIKIDYNMWNISRDYRITKANELGYPEADVDTGMIYVPANGGGSSFTRQSPINTEEDRMERLNRWKNVIDDPGFRYLVSVPLIRRLSEEIWPELTAEVLLSVV